MILFDNVTKRYPGTARPALSAIDFKVNRGEFVFLVGASGSGKSSCLQLILREEKPSAGTIHVLGQNLGSISNRKVPYFRRNLGVVFQDFRLLPNKTVFENVAFTLQVIGKSAGFIQEAVPDVLGMVGLTGKSARLPHELSGGEQQRVAIARAVVNKPALLLADEPTGNLDPTTSAGIMALLERINEGGTTVIMATHEAGIVDQMQRRVVELVGGEIVRDERRGGYGNTASIPGYVRGGRSSNADDEVAEKPTESLVSPAHVAEACDRPPLVVAHSRSDVTLVPPIPAIPDVPVLDPVHTVAHALNSEEVTVSDGVVVDHSDTSLIWSERFPTRPVTRPSAPETGEDPLVEQLTLAERLGLRAPGGTADQTGEQDVGPTR